MLDSQLKTNQVGIYRIILKESVQTGLCRKSTRVANQLQHLVERVF